MPPPPRQLPLHGQLLRRRICGGDAAARQGCVHAHHERSFQLPWQGEERCDYERLRRITKAHAARFETEEDVRVLESVV